MGEVRALTSIPTCREAGYPALEFDGLVGAFGTPAVTEAVRDKIANDVIEFLSDPIILDRLTATGQVVNAGTPAEFGAAIDEQKAQAAAVAKTLGLKGAQ